MSLSRYVYGIEDANTGCLVYVGCSRRPLGVHGREGDHLRGNVDATKVAIESGAIRPRFIVLQEVKAPGGGDAESDWIRYLSLAGEPLLNKNLGGGGLGDSRLKLVQNGGDIYTTREVGNAVGETQQTILEWKQTGMHDIPKPDTKHAQLDAWRSETIEPWIRERRDES